MDRFLMQYVLKLNRDSKRKKWWHNIVRTLAVIVVFCTTYALILPAITMEKDIICGIKAHEHKSSCYEYRKIYDLDCVFANESSTEIRHIHEIECYDLDGDLRCPLEEGSDHVHNSSCYASASNSMDARELDCSYASMLYHSHGDECLVDTGETLEILTCKKEEHIHEDACYLEKSSGLKYICGSGEHTHYENCYDEEDELVCTIPEHTHDSECMSERSESGSGTSKRWKASGSNGRKASGSDAWKASGSDAWKASDSDAWNASASNAMKPTTGGTLFYEGEDFTVTVTYDAEAKIPAEAELTVREIMADTEEYDQYYRQSLGALSKQSSKLYTKNAEITEQQAEEYEQKIGENVLFARFFDIGFIVGDEEIEPASPVEVQIKYEQAIETPSENEGVAVHFAEDGIEVLDTEIDGGREEEIDSFTFTQNSFSVTGTFIMNAAVVDPLEEGEYLAATIPFSEADTSGNTRYVIYTKYEGNYYAVIANYNDKTGYAKNVELDQDGNIRWNDLNANMFWKITRNGSTGSSYYIQNSGSSRYLHAFDNSAYNNYPDYGTTTQGTNPSAVTVFSDGGFRAQGNTYYTGVAENGNTVTFNRVSGSDNAAVFYLARYETSHIWLDGTLGGLMSFQGSDNTHYTISPENPVFTLPETWKSPTRYDYVLRGWYDIYSGEYYPVDLDDGVDGIKVLITQNTVFYADWVPASYAIGQNNENTVRTVDTSEYVTIDVFDYNVLFNTLSTTFTGTVTSSGHSETWSEEDDTLNFLFNDWDPSGDISRSNNMSSNNSTYDRIVENIINKESIGLIDLLFDPKTEVIGKNYVGTGNYLFQYMDDPTDEYYGYYYYDSDRNAASYYYDEIDPSKSRFYVYNYLERTSDAGTENGADFMPLNSPYANTGGLTVEEDSNGMYVYESKGDAGNVSSNFHLGLRTNIHFYLPNDVGHEDAYGNPGNLDTNGKEMIFRFAGDDDVWVFVDGELVLDIGGIHGVESGTINFSTGEVTNGITESSITAVRDESGAIVSGIGEGGHNLTIYYLERGSSQSNCKMYFNLAPRYGMTLLKQDYHTRENLNGVEFKVYTNCTNCSKGICEIGADGNCILDDCNCTTVFGLTGACEVGADGSCVTAGCQCKTVIGVNHPVVPAKLWHNHEAAKADKYDEYTTNRFTVQNNELVLFGLVAGKTYYIAESVPASGYPRTDDLIRVTLNNHGTDISELTVLDGADDERTQGYEIVEHSLDETTQTVHMVLTNQRIIPDTEITQQVRVTKEWILQEDNPAKIPDSITVHLTKDGQEYGHSMELSEANGWTYTWTGLPADGSVYDVVEDQVPGFTIIPPASTFALTRANRQYIVNWLEVAALEDGVTFLLKIGDKYLAQNNGSLSVETIETDNAGQLAPSESMKWTVNAQDEGFLLSNGGYCLTLEGSYFRAERDGNKVLYYDGSGLFAMRDGRRYYLGTVSGGSASASTTEYAVGLVKEELIAVDVHKVQLLNYQLDEEDMTYLEVEKVWAETNEPVWEKEVTVRLIADGVDTGMTLVLNNEVKWKGRFEGLPVGPKYSVVEEPVPKYSITYSDVIEVPGGEVSTWETTGTLAENGIYCFVNGGYAMTDRNGSLVGTTFSESNLKPAANQQWKVINGRLQNVETGRYLGMEYTWGYCRLYVTSQSNQSSGIWMQENSLRLSATDGETFRYISINGSSISTSNNPTKMKIYQGRTEKYPASYKVTVTNTYGAHYLPQTGGTGTNYHIYSGLLLLAAAAFMYMKRRMRMQRKGAG